MVKPSPDQPRISIIIPVLNEVELLKQRLHSLQPIRAQGHELIVVDGGSVDGSLQCCQGLADKFGQAQRGRASQMNYAASIASGSILLFLHVDTELPEAAAATVIRGLQQSTSAWGRFDIGFTNPALVFTLIAAMMNWRSRITRVCTGDQAIFIHASLFRQVGGFASISLMEDVELSKRLRRISRPVCLAAKVTTSSRRWETRGVLKTVLLMWSLRLQYFFGASPERLASRYYPRAKFSAKAQSKRL